MDLHTLYLYVITKSFCKSNVCACGRFKNEARKSDNWNYTYIYIRHAEYILFIAVYGLDFIAISFITYYSDLNKWFISIHSLIFRLNES